MPSLQVQKGGPPGQVVALDGDLCVLGRNPDCHVVIAGTAVSRAHAHIIRVNGKYFIEDMKSRNGTYVNNELIKDRVELKDSDKIKICDFVCSFHETPALKPLPAAFRDDDTEEDDPVGAPAPTPYEATLSHATSRQILEAQPAEKLKAVLEISTNLRGSIELDTLLPKIVDSLFGLFKQADRCFVILADDNNKKLIPKVIKTRRPNDESTARFSRRIVNHCMETVQALLTEDASNDQRFAMSQSIADFRIRSVMAAPLWTQDDKAIGVIQLDSQDRTKKFTQDDLNLLMCIATQASLVLENAKLVQDLVARERIKRDLEVAREVQRGFLPSRLPEIPGYEFFAHYESAFEVGGDYYDVVPLPNHRVAVMLGDVAGKGVPAALLMAKVSSDARFCMLTQADAGSAITHLNVLMNQAGLAERFVTLAAAVLDTNRHVVTIVNAGHPVPLLYHRQNSSFEDAAPHAICGLPIGVVEGCVYDSCQVPLQPGDAIVLFSDGVTEAMDVNNVQLELKGIRAAVQGGGYSPRVVGERIIQAVKRHAAGRHPHDDVTLVAFGRTGP
jgi:serine phosphatase RsbU (regulator of sigma subunit)/pSer/pThr/pTyr-binding forkhead associated (FHA) protein